MRLFFLVFIVLVSALSSISQEIVIPPAYRVYKQIDFSSLDVGANTLERARAFMGSDEIQSSWAHKLWDSTIIMGQDTVWKTYIPPTGGSVGTQWFGKMKLNGTNYAADTLTYARFSYYIQLDGDHWDWSNGGKTLGISGDGLANDGSGLPQGGVWTEGCEGDNGEHVMWDGTYGFTGTGGFDGPLHEGTETVGLYTYHHDMTFSTCKNLTYGDTWYMDGTANTTNLSWERGKWYKITIGYKLNSVASPGNGNADGIITWSRNDTCYGVKTAVIMRNYESITIDQWSLKTFHGGGADATRTDENYIYYDDLTLWQDNDFTLPVLNEVETNVPVMPTPNIESEIIEPEIIEIEDDTQPPSIPTGIVLTRVTSSSLEFGWQSSTDNVGVDHYEIRLNGVFEATVDSLSYAATELNQNTRYAITIRAFDKAGNFSQFSQEVSRNTETEVPPDNSDKQAPTTPTGLKEQMVTNQSITLSWNPSTDNVAVIGYKIHLNNEIKGETSSNNTTIEDLRAGLNYVISISAFDEAGNESLKSSALQVRVLNDDFTTNPTLPEVYIVDLQRNSNNPSSLAEVKSLGHTEVDAYGIMVTTGNQPVEEGHPIFAKQDLSEVVSKGRVTEGLQLLYNFSDKEGSIVSEISGAGEPLDLQITRPLNSNWTLGQGLKLIGNSSLIYEGSPTRLLESLASTNEITIEAWISQCETEQNGPARIVTLSNGTSSEAVMLGHEGNISSYNYVTRLNTTNTDSNGLPELVTSTDFTGQSLHHVVYTRSTSGIEKMYVNGIELSSGVRKGDFSSWEEDYRLVLGNEIDGERPWNGTFYLVAIYNEALNEASVIQNFISGFGKIRYTTELSELKPNTTYKLHPFVRTDQGIVYGEKKSFLIENVLFSEEKDSLYMAVYPNPSNGDFKIHVEYENSISHPALLRIVNMSGQIIFGQELKFKDEYVNTDLDINLSTQIKEGIYSAILIVGTKAFAQKLIIY